MDMIYGNDTMYCFYSRPGPKIRITGGMLR